MNTKKEDKAKWENFCNEVISFYRSLDSYNFKQLLHQEFSRINIEALEEYFEDD